MISRRRSLLLTLQPHRAAALIQVLEAQVHSACSTPLCSPTRSTVSGILDHTLLVWIRTGGAKVRRLCMLLLSANSHIQGQVQQHDGASSRQNARQ